MIKNTNLFLFLKNKKWIEFIHDSKFKALIMF